MKILQVCNRFYPAIGGVETYVLNLTKRSVKDGNFVKVVCSNMVRPNSNERFRDKSGIIDGVFFERFKSFRILGIDATTFIPYLPLFLIFNAKKYDVVHVHSYGYFTSWASILICKIFNKKIIYTPHYANETVLPLVVKKTFDFLIAGWSFRMATGVIALTSVEKEILIKKFKIKPKNVSIIPNGIDMNEYEKNFLTDKEKEEVLNRNGISNGRKNIITIARIAKNKGHIYLLKTFEKISNCNLIIIGKDWGEKANLIKYIQEKNIPNVYFLENIDDVEKNNLLKLSDIFVLSSLGGEAFGIVLLEAMTNGLPIIASNVGGIKDLIQEGKNGYLVEPRNTGQIKEKIEAILLNKDIKSMKKYCRDFVSEYDWEKVYKKINNLYQDVLFKKIKKQV